MTCVLIREDGERRGRLQSREEGHVKMEQRVESFCWEQGCHKKMEEARRILPEGLCWGRGVCCQHPNFRLLPSRSLRKNISLALSHRHVLVNFDINPRKLIHFQSLILIENNRYVISLMHDFHPFLDSSAQLPPYCLKLRYPEGEKLWRFCCFRFQFLGPFWPFSPILSPIVQLLPHRLASPFSWFLNFGMEIHILSNPPHPQIHLSLLIYIQCSEIWSLFVCNSAI